MMKKLSIAVGASALFFAVFAGATTIFNVSPERGELLYSGVTGTTGGSANTVLTLTKQATCVGVENTTNVEVMVTRSATDFKRVPALSYRVIDFGANGTAFGSGVVFKAYVTGATGSTGYVEVLTCSSTR